MCTWTFREVFEDVMANCAMVGCSTVTSSRFQMYSTSLVENPSEIWTKIDGEKHLENSSIASRQSQLGNNYPVTKQGIVLME